MQLLVLIPVAESPLKIRDFMVSLTSLFSVSDLAETPTRGWKTGKGCYSGA